MHVPDNGTEVSLFRVLAKRTGYSQDRGEYTAENLYELLRWLKITEDISFDTCEYLYVHLQLPDGSVQEVVAHDKSNNLSDSVVPINKKARPYTPEDVKIIKEVGELLKKASSEEPEPKPKKVRQGKIRTGFGVIAYPARSGDYVEE